MYICFSPDGALLVAGFGHPDDAAYEGERLLAVCDAHTLTALWVTHSFLGIIVLDEIISIFIFLYHGLRMPIHCRFRYMTSRCAK